MATDRLGIAAHLHVLLRRKTGRVTDIEWMVANEAYAAEIVRFATARAAEDGAPELKEWADKLAAALAEAVPPTRRPLVAAVRARMEAPSPGGLGQAGHVESAFFPSQSGSPSQLPGGETPPGGDESDAQRYVRGLR